MIESATFADCENLKTIEFSEGLETIGVQAFRECGVESIVTPKSLKTIHSGAFRECDNLKQVVLADTLEALGVEGSIEGHT